MNVSSIIFLLLISRFTNIASEFLQTPVAPLQGSLGSAVATHQHVMVQVTTMHKILAAHLFFDIDCDESISGNVPRWPESSACTSGNLSFIDCSSGGICFQRTTAEGIVRIYQQNSNKLAISR